MITSPVHAFKNILNRLRPHHVYDMVEFRILFEKFRNILKGNNRVLELIAELEDKISGDYIFDIHYLQKTTSALSEELYRVVSNLNILSGNKYSVLFDIHSRIQLKLDTILEGKSAIAEAPFVVRLDEIDRDDEELVGGKNAVLGEIRNHLRFDTPDGFAITAAAYHEVIKHNALMPKIRGIFQPGKADKPQLSEKEREEAVERLFKTVTIPPALSKSIVYELKNLYKKRKRKPYLAIRSSAVGEDESARSYAGQFRSMLNISADKIVPAYISIITSRFKHLPYSSDIILHDSDSDLPMAVSVQEMIRAKAAGVAYSLDPAAATHDRMIISAVFGLGIPVVSGTANSDLFYVSRLHPSEIIEKKIVKKETMEVPVAHGGTEVISVPGKLQRQPSVSDRQVIQIAEIAFVLERYFKKPQDIEWAVDENDQIHILQSRPLIMSARPQKKHEKLLDSLNQYQVLLNKQGIIANRGIAAGKVYVVSEDMDAEAFPLGAIAVAQHSSPKLAPVIRKTAAIITDVGSSTGHMATLAREFGVPAIIGAGNATSILHTDMEITVDAQENIVYKGIIGQLLEYEIKGEDIYIDMPEYKVLRRILKRVAPLHLIDPGSKDFTGENCRTFHDIIRFSHEKAVLELINLNISSRRFPDIEPKALQLPIPLGLKVIDIGGGLTPLEKKQGKISPEDVISLPMKATLQGLTAPSMWSTDPVELRFGDFMSSITRYSDSDKKLAYQGENLAVISDNYMNLSLRLGYHFNVIDAYISRNINDNYIYFRFVGGVTEDERRHRRALVIKSILEKNNFKVTVKGELVVGSIKKSSEPELKKILNTLGKLIGFTRQLDAKMQSEESVSYYTNSFFELHDKNIPLKE